MLIFELGRYSIGKTKGNLLTFKDIIKTSLLVSFYGICFQLIIDLTASAVGFYYYINPPSLNIFGYPIIFIFVFGIYGLFAFIFLIFKKRFLEQY